MLYLPLPLSGRARIMPIKFRISAPRTHPVTQSPGHSVTISSSLPHMMRSCRGKYNVGRAVERGFGGVLNNSDNTSPSPCGGLWVAPARSSVSWVGNRKLKITATMAALKVPTRYRPIMGFKLVSLSAFWLAMDEATSTNTRIGATAFRARTNNFPSIVSNLAVSGAATAKTTPRIMATMIW